MKFSSVLMLCLPLALMPVSARADTKDAAAKVPIVKAAAPQLTFVKASPEEVADYEKRYESAFELAKSAFNQELDGTEPSVLKLELMMGVLSSVYATVDKKANEGLLLQYSDVLGAYLGGLMVKHQGGVWGKVHVNDSPVAEMAVQSATSPQVVLLPVQRVKQRITQGEQFSVSDYYRELTPKAASN